MVDENKSSKDIGESEIGKSPGNALGGSLPEKPQELPTPKLSTKMHATAAIPKIYAILGRALTEAEQKALENEIESHPELTPDKISGLAENYARTIKEDSPVTPEAQRPEPKTLVSREETVKYLSERFSSSAVRLMIERFDKYPEKCKDGGYYIFEVVQSIVGKQKEKGREFTKRLEALATKPVEQPGKRIPTIPGELRRIDEILLTKEKTEEYLSKTVGNETMQLVFGELDRNPGAFMEGGKYRLGAVKKLVAGRFNEKGVDFTIAKTIPALKAKPVEQQKAESLDSHVIDITTKNSDEKKPEGKTKMSPETPIKQYTKPEVPVKETHSTEKSHAGLYVGVAAFAAAVLALIMAFKKDSGSIDYDRLERAQKTAVSESINALESRLNANYDNLKGEIEKANNSQDKKLKEQKENIAQETGKKLEETKQGLYAAAQESNKKLDERLGGIETAQTAIKTDVGKVTGAVGKLAAAQKSAEEAATKRYDEQQKALQEANEGYKQGLLDFGKDIDAKIKLVEEKWAKPYGEVILEIDKLSAKDKLFEEQLNAYLQREQKKENGKKETIIPTAGGPEPDNGKKPLLGEKPGAKKTVEKKAEEPKEPRIIVRDVSLLWNYLYGERTIGSSTARENAQQLKFDFNYGTKSVQLSLGVDAQFGKLSGDVEGNNDLTDYTVGLRLFEKFGGIAASIEGDYLIHTINQDGKVPDDALVFSKLGNRLEGYQFKVGVDGIKVLNLSLGLEGSCIKDSGHIYTKTNISGTEIRSVLDGRDERLEGKAKLQLVELGENGEGLNFVLIARKETMKEEDISYIQRELGAGLELNAQLYKQLHLFADAKAMHCKREVDGADIKTKNGVEAQGSLGFGLEF